MERTGIIEGLVSSADNDNAVDITCGPGHFCKLLTYWGEKISGRGKQHAWDETHVHIYSSQESLRLLRAARFTVNAVTRYHYPGILPAVGRWGMPITNSKTIPFNRLALNTIVEYHKRETPTG